MSNIDTIPNAINSWEILPAIIEVGTSLSHATTIANIGWAQRTHDRYMNLGPEPDPPNLDRVLKSTRIYNQARNARGILVHTIGQIAATQMTETIVYDPEVLDEPHWGYLHAETADFFNGQAPDGEEFEQEIIDTISPIVGFMHQATEQVVSDALQFVNLTDTNYDKASLADYARWLYVIQKATEGEIRHAIDQHVISQVQIDDLLDGLGVQAASDTLYQRVSDGVGFGIPRRLLHTQSWKDYSFTPGYLEGVTASDALGSSPDLRIDNKETFLRIMGYYAMGRYHNLDQAESNTDLIINGLSWRANQTKRISHQVDHLARAGSYPNLRLSRGILVDNVARCLPLSREAEEGGFYVKTSTRPVKGKCPARFGSCNPPESVRTSFKRLTGCYERRFGFTPRLSGQQTLAEMYVLQAHLTTSRPGKALDPETGVMEKLWQDVLARRAELAQLN